MSPTEEQAMVAEMRAVLVAEGVEMTPDIERLIRRTAEWRWALGGTDGLDAEWWHGAEIETSKGTMSPRQVVDDPVLVREAIANVEGALSHS